MKKKLIGLLLTAIMVCGMMPSALAATDEATQAAQTLYELGLFKGTGTNADGSPIFDLDKTPTRNQALIMLIRLLGKEEEALTIDWGSIPFTDVPEDMRPYVAYAYANALTNGYTETMFNGTAPITANQYIAFLLRALGYESGRDFEVSSACAFSDALGLTHGEFADGGTFTRGDVAELSVSALDTETRDGKGETLLETLKAPEPEVQKPHHRDDDDDDDDDRTAAPEPTPTPPAPQSTITLTGGKPVGDPWTLNYQTEQRPLAGEVYGWTVQKLDNDHTRFTVEYTVPAGLSISVFAPGQSDILMQVDTTGTAGEKSTLQFDVSDAVLAQIEQITINFFDGSDRFFVYCERNDWSPPADKLTDGTPIGTAETVTYNTSNGGDVTGTVHSYTAQRLDNGYTRFTVEYTVPAGMSISIFDSPNGEIMSQIDTTGTTGEKSTLQFDVSNEALAQMEKLTVKFWADGDKKFSVFFKLEDNDRIRGLASAVYFGLPADIKWIDAPTNMDDLNNNILYSFLLGNYSLNFTNVPKEMWSKDTVTAVRQRIRILSRKYPELMGVVCNVNVGCGIKDSKLFIDFGESDLDTDAGKSEIYQQQRTALTTAIGIKNALHKDGTITDSMTQLQVAQVYYDYLCELNVSAGGGSEAAKKGESWKYDTPYACLVNKKADCVGRAGAFDLLMHLEGIAAEGVSGQIKDTDSGHVLSRVKLDNQTYYCDWGNRRPIEANIDSWFEFD